MAYIPVSEIPNAPGAPQMPLPQYQGIPNIRYATQDWSVNMRQRAADLMQGPLPGGIEEGLNRAASVAGTGQMAMGKALAAGGEAIAKGLSNISGMLTRVVVDANKSNDDAAEMKQKDAQKAILQKMETELTEENVPIQEWPATFKERYMPQYDALTKDLGVTPFTKDKLAADSQGFIASTDLKYRLKAAEKTHEDNAEWAKSRYIEGINEKDPNKAGDAADYLEKEKYLPQSAITKMRDGITQMQHYDGIQAAINLKPHEVREDMRNVMKGGKSKDFEWLNNDSAEQAKWYNAADAAATERETSLAAEITQNIVDGKTYTDAELDQLQKDNYLPPKVVSGWKKTLKENVPYDEGKMASFVADLTAYDGIGDEGGKKFQEFLHRLNTEIPKDQRAPLLEELKKTRKDALEGKLRGPQKAEQEIVQQALKELASKGYLRDPVSGVERKRMPTGEEKLKPGERMTDVEEARWHTNNRRWVQIQTQLLEWAKTNPNFAPGDLYKQMEGAVDPFMKSAGITYAPSDQEIKDQVAQKQIEQSRKLPAGQSPFPSYPKELLQERQIPYPGTKPFEAPTEEEILRKRGGQPPGPTSRLKSTPEFEAATMGEGERHTVRTVTNYVPGMGGQEGGNEVKGRGGPAYTMEDFREGKAPWVSVAADEKSDLQGKFLISTNPELKGVVFKVEDIGTALQGQGEKQLDIAWRDKAKAGTGSKSDVNFVEINEGVARGIGAKREIEEGEGGLSIYKAIDSSNPAMGRPRDPQRVSRIVVHGDVSTDVPALIAYSKKVDRGYHFYIGLDGDITQAVPVSRIANHIKGGNSDSIGIILVGADNGKMPTRAQNVAAAMLISRLGRYYGISPRNVAGHGELQPGRRDVREGGNIARMIRDHGFI